MSVVQLGTGCSTDFLLYEDTPINVSYSGLEKVQGSIDVRSLLAISSDGYIIKAKAFQGIPNLMFYINYHHQKSVKSLI